MYVYSSTRVGELPYVMGMVGDRVAKMLVDSGAGATLVHKKLLVPNVTKLRKTTMRVTGVTGADLDIAGEAEVQIEIKGLRTLHNCLIVGDMENDVLLGYVIHSKDDVIWPEILLVRLR